MSDLQERMAAALADLNSLGRDAARWRWLLDSKNAMATFEAAYWNSASSEQLEALVDAARRAEQFPGIDIDAAHKKA